MNEWVFKPSPNCPRLMEAERRCVGSESQTVHGAATWRLRRPIWVLVRQTSMSRRSAERKCALPA